MVMSAGEEQVERFRAAFERHYAAVLAYALRRLQSPADAEEIAATTFVLAWRRIDLLPVEPYTRTWLYRTAWRTLANQRRADGRQARVLERFTALSPPASSGSLGPDPLLDEGDEDGVLLEAMERLRPSEQEVLRLVAWEELTYAEAADVLGCSLSNFAVRLHRARAALRKELERVESRRTFSPLARAGHAEHAGHDGRVRPGATEASR